MEPYDTGCLCGRVVDDIDRALIGSVLAFILGRKTQIQDLRSMGVLAGIGDERAARSNCAVSADGAEFAIISRLIRQVSMREQQASLSFYVCVYSS